MKKAVLLAAGYDFRNHPGLSLQIVPPLGILSIGSYLASRGIPVELIDVQVDFGVGMTQEAESAVCGRVIGYLQKQSADIGWIGVSLLSNTGFGIPLARLIHVALPDVPIVLGGYYPTTNCESLLRNQSFISAIVLGDGEEAALRISRSLDRREPFLSNLTPNLAWLGPDGEVRRTALEPICLEDAPILDVRLLSNLPHYPAMDLVSSRGCPFACSYCLESRMRPYSEYPSTWLRRQLDHLQTHAPGRPVLILDPIFVVSRRRTLEICEVLRAYSFRYHVESRVDTISPELVPVLRTAGVDLVFLGLESASADTLLRMRKVGSLPAAERYLARALDVVESCFKNDITVMLNIMLDFPGDRELDLQATVEFAVRARRLYDRSGARAGFAPSILFTSIFSGSQLAERLQAGDFPGVTLQDSAFDGEKTVVSSSSETDPGLAGRYAEELRRLGAASSPLFAERLSSVCFSPAGFMATHPELTDSEGVTLLRP